MPCLGIPTVGAFKIVETDAFDVGYGGILKQRVSPESFEQIVRFYSDIWNNTQLNCSTIKRYGLVVSAKKIKLFQTKVRFLGYDISEGQIRPIDRAIQFADKFPDVIIDKIQLQRFLGSLNYVADFYKDMRKQCKLLFDRLKSNPPHWSDVHTSIVKQIKSHVKTLPCLGIPTISAFKIVETEMPLILVMEVF